MRVARAKSARRALLPGVLLAFLAACEPSGGTGAGVLAGMSRATAPATARIANGRINVAGPAGFCVQRDTRIKSGGGGFIALGQCASISANPADATVANPALLTVSATPLADPTVATPEALERYFAQGGGRAGVESTETRNGVVFVRARDASSRRPDGLNDAYWRALYQSGGYLISLNVSSLADSPISGATGHAILTDFVKAMQGANADTENGSNGMLSLFNRLL